MATKRPASSDLDGAPMDPKRFCAEGPSSSLSSLGGTTTSTLPSLTSPPSTVSPLTFPIPASRPLFATTVPPTHNIVQGPPPSLSPSVWYMPTLHAGTVTVQQGNDPVHTPDSTVLISSSSSPFLHSITSKVSSAVPMSSIPVLSGANVGNRQPICSVDIKPVVIKEKGHSSLKSIRAKILKNRRARITALKLKCESLLREKFFLESGGNMMEFVSWRKKPNVLREDFVKHNSLDAIVWPQGSMTLLVPPAVSTGNVFAALTSSEATVSLKTNSIENVATISDRQLSKSPLATESDVTKSMSTDSSSSLPSSTTVQIPLSTVSPGLHATPPKRSTPISPSRSISFPSSSPRPATRAHASFSMVYENSHEDIVMRARQEAEVMKSISELRKEGLWSASRLPKVQEPVRIKTHWDYLLEEMQWLATDFGNEKRWKMNAARKLSRSIAHYHKESHMQQEKSKKEDLMRLRKIASSIAKEVKHFWDSIQKVVEHKQQLMLEAKRKKAMDLHLDYIVDQTTKYSDWIAKDLGHQNSSSSSTRVTPGSVEDSDAFLSPPEESDDENTIEVEENIQFKEGEVNYQDEISELHAEGEMSLEELLASLPKELLMPDQLLEEEEEEKMVVSISAVKDGLLTHSEGLSLTGEVAAVQDQDWGAGPEGEAEDEHTVQEQEGQEMREDHGEEKGPLMDDEEDSSDGGDESDGDPSKADGESGLGCLVGKNLDEACRTEVGLNDVAAAAEKFKPTGFTLETTQVKTVVPFLLKHTLREYQHIGLDWLVAMYERKLNGILADEMGLGKTMQTIALLAHLVCERGIWGPHLVIVPTSVLLNWECELKKWCPALKILTYFGSLKERKQKRIGWSKRNAFHVCITSYNVAVTDHRAFKQKKWKYLILDEAQNIKNFKSQRWRTLLNFHSQYRLLLTGTPLQNNLMELWSLMHFLMPAIFSSHSDFKEWFSNPLSGMIEGSQEYNDSIVKRLHQVLRPFLLRRIKSEVEKQMPKKYEHVIPCQLSKRQRFLYDEFMSRAKTKDSLAGGNYLSVINVLMQLRKVCNHPDLFEPRPIISPFQMQPLEFYTASKAFSALHYDPLEHVDLNNLNLKLCEYELEMDAFASFRSRQLAAPRMLFMEPNHIHGNQLDAAELEGGDASDSNLTRAQVFLEDLHVPALTEKMQNWTLSRCRHLYDISSRRCRRTPVYGRDLITAVTTNSHHSPHHHCMTEDEMPPGYWLWVGYSNCSSHQAKQLHSENIGNALDNVVLTMQRRFDSLNEVIKRFLLVIPSAVSQSVSMVCHHPHPSRVQQTVDLKRRMTNVLAVCTALHHPVLVGTSFQFPERRLVQYDCGKLQTLDLLLRKLKLGGHRVLIFTQMSRMLDVLEIFLNYHGLAYLRLDGSTPVQKRQYLMDRFNRDERLFCFILSTRSGGLGVNLTGADTVVFYDSDWNPTMDAQAQDRCHRIGQTRDVHIYRLICVRTVEENILKKANQKKMLGDIAIEGGAFTTDFFKQVSLQELFSASTNIFAAKEETGEVEQKQDAPCLSENQMEDLLLQAEDAGDAKAVSKAKAEQVAEMAEFDENFSAQYDEKDKAVDEDNARTLAEIAAIEEQLNGIEKYAMHFMEEENAEFSKAQLRRAEENIELAKKDWELSHLISLKEEQDDIIEENLIDEGPLTYDRPDNNNKVWLPPSPPSEDSNNYFIDSVVEMNYNTQTVIEPTVLASIATLSEEEYDVFGLKRRNADSVPVKKTSKSSKPLKERMNVPPSLFWKRFATDSLSTKLKKLATHQKKIKCKDQFTPLLDQQPEGPEWTIDEDWIVLKSITSVLELPISLTIIVPAQIPNWSIIADITSSLSRVQRSPLQCREHLMNIVIPREDGTAKTDGSFEVKKLQKSKEFTTKKSRGRREQRTKGLVLSDNGKEHTKQYSSTFDLIIQAGVNRKETPKFTWDTMQKPSTHSDFLKDYGLDIEKVQSPMFIAQLRADRIQEHSRPNPVQQILSGQPYHPLSSVVRPYAGNQFTKALPDKSKLICNMPHPSGPSPGQAPQRVQNSNSTMGISPSKTVTATLPTTTSTVLNVSQLPSTSSLPATVGKAYSATATGVGDLGKILGITRGFTPQQLLLLKQQTSLHQHQQALATATSTQHVQAISAQTQAAIVQQKLSLPTGIEQLRATVASAASSVLPRFTGMTTSSGSTVKGLTGGRTRHVEEVLKQQSLRMAAKAALPQAAGAATIVQVPSAKVQELEKLVTKSGMVSSGDKGQVKTATQLAKHDKV